MTGERGDLLQSLAKQRYFLRYTVRDLTDEQAARQTTASELCLGGLIKHVALVEQQWISFILDGPGTSWSARRVLLHVIAETAQHAGHADIIRETLDGAKSMG